MSTREYGESDNDEETEFVTPAYHAINGGPGKGVYELIIKAIDYMDREKGWEIGSFDIYTDALFFAYPELLRGCSEITQDKDGNDLWHVYTDGACSNNGKPNAKAGVGIYWGPGAADNISERLRGKVQTNQRAELAAILETYRIINRRENKVNYVLHTDSKYAIDCLTKWKRVWEKNGWLNNKGEPVVNQDIIKKILDEEPSGPCGSVTLEYVPAHSGDECNEEADKFAREAIM